MRIKLQGQPFEILVIYQNLKHADNEPVGLSASGYEIVVPNSPVDSPIRIASTFGLIIEIQEEASMHCVTVKYALDLYQLEFVRDLLATFHKMLLALASTTECVLDML